MEELQNQQRELKQLEENLDAVLSIDPESLVRDNLGEELSFKEALPIFVRLRGLFQDLRMSTLQELPATTLHQMNAVNAKVLDVFKRIREFSATQHDTAGVRNRLMVSVGEVWHQSYSTVGPVIAYALGTPPRLREAYENLSDVVGRIETKEKHAENTLMSLKQRGEEFLEKTERDSDKVEVLASDAGVEFHARHFAIEAKWSRIASYVWLTAAIILAAAVVGYAEVELVRAFEKLPDQASNRLIAQFIIVRLIVVSVLTFAVSFCSRNYSASRHNFVVNRHRQNSLSSFQTFKGAATSDDVKDAVLMEATRSIFAAQSSGYVKGVTEPQAGGPLVEILGRLSRTRGKESN